MVYRSRQTSVPSLSGGHRGGNDGMPGLAGRADKHREARVSTKAPRPLTSAQTLHILPQVGPNTLPEPHLLPLWQRVLRAVPDPLVLVLLGAIVLSADVADTVVIALVIVVKHDHGGAPGDQC